MLALLIAVALREHGLIGFVVALAAVGWADLAQFVRGEVIRIRASAYVEAARALGVQRGRGAARARPARSRAAARRRARARGRLRAPPAGQLGFIGLFISGGAFYVDDSNRPILPIRDRAPEWGQMLAGVRQYAFSQQYVAFIPGVVVVAAVFAFNLFGEGLRAASDPFGAKRLSPRALGGLARGLGALALVGIVGYGVITLRSGEIAFTDAMRQAREAAAWLQPSARLVAGVVRFTAGAHALAKPEKINFYFREPRLADDPPGRLRRRGPERHGGEAVRRGGRPPVHQLPADRRSGRRLGRGAAPGRGARGPDLSRGQRRVDGPRGTCR